MDISDKLYFPAFFILLVTSCSSIKNIKYFKDIPDSAKTTQLARVNFIEPKIQPDDILSVNIQTADPAATQILSMGNVQSSAVGSTTAGGTGGQTVSGYLVDSKAQVSEQFSSLEIYFHNSLIFKINCL